MRGPSTTTFKTVCRAVNCLLVIPGNYDVPYLHLQHHGPVEEPRDKIRVARAERFLSDLNSSKQERVCLSVLALTQEGRRRKRRPWLTLAKIAVVERRLNNAGPPACSEARQALRT